MKPNRLFFLCVLCALGGLNCSATENTEFTEQLVREAAQIKNKQVAREDSHGRPNERISDSQHRADAGVALFHKTSRYCECLLVLARPAAVMFNLTQIPQLRKPHC